MKKYPDFWSVIVGDGGAGFLLGYIVIAIFCAGVLAIRKLSRRNVESARTPTKLSFRFWLADNMPSVLSNVLLIPITIRLLYEYVDPTWMLFLSAGIGFGYEFLAGIANKFGILTTSKLASRITEKIESNGK